MGCKVRMEEVDNPPASSCRAQLPAGVRQTPGTTELRTQNTKDDDRNENFAHFYLNCLTQETQSERWQKKRTTHSLQCLQACIRINFMMIILPAILLHPSVAQLWGSSFGSSKPFCFLISHIQVVRNYQVAAKNAPLH